MKKKRKNNKKVKKQNKSNVQNNKMIDKENLVLKNAKVDNNQKINIKNNNKIETNKKPNNECKTKKVDDVQKENDNIKKELKSINDKKVEEKLDVNSEKNIEKTIDKSQESKTEKKKNKNLKIKKFFISLLCIIILFVIIDVILIYKTIGNNQTIEENMVDQKQNIMEDVIEENVSKEYVLESSFSEFEFKGYNFKIDEKYKVNKTDDILTLQFEQEKSIVTINAGTMEQIQDNLDLLVSPIENQGGTVVKKPELQNINGRNLYVLEYEANEKNYIIAYTNLDEENIIDIVSENNSSLNLLVELADNCNKVD